MSAAWCRWEGETLFLSLHVQPRASRDEVQGTHGERLKVRITAPPVEGAANAHLIRFLANELRVSKAQVRIVSGQTGRDKRVAVHAPRNRPGWLAVCPPPGGGAQVA